MKLLVALLVSGLLLVPTVASFVSGMTASGIMLSGLTILVFCITFRLLCREKSTKDSSSR